MADDNVPGRRYDETEIGALIQRATELHGQAEEGSEHGLSIQELEHIAHELGIPREHLQAAALEMDNRPVSEQRSSFLGAPFAVNESRATPGTLTDERWHEMVLELRRFIGHEGTVSEFGQSRNWMHFVGEGENGFNFKKTVVTTRSKSGQTLIQLRKDFLGVAFLYVIPILLTFFLTGALLTEQPGPLKFALAAGVLAGVFAIVRSFVSRTARRQAQKLSRLADRLEDALTTTVSAIVPDAVVAAATLPEATLPEATLPEATLPDAEQDADRIELSEQDEPAEPMNNAEAARITARRNTR